MLPYKEAFFYYLILRKEDKMKIILNGEEKELTSEIPLINFLTDQNLDPDKLVIEYNQEIIQQKEWSSIILTAGDKLEVLKFVGGG